MNSPFTGSDQKHTVIKTKLQAIDCCRITSPTELFHQLGRRRCVENANQSSLLGCSCETGSIGVEGEINHFVLMCIQSTIPRILSRITSSFLACIQADCPWRSRSCKSDESNESPGETFRLPSTRNHKQLLRGYTIKETLWFVRNSTECLKTIDSP